MIASLWRRAGVLGAVCLLLAACSGAPAQDQSLRATIAALQTKVAAGPSPTPASELVARADAYLAPLAKSGDFSGAVLLSRGYGLASAEHDVPNGPRTKFRLASITKTFTAAAILKLQQQGRLSVKDSVCKYLPDCPAAWRPVAIEHLLAHTSGIPDPTTCAGCPRPPIRAAMTIEQVVQTLTRFYADAPLDSPPGATFVYSNQGYGLLGYVVERASGQRYEEYLRANIFDPLGMRDTGQDHDSLILKGRATGYSTVNVLADYSPIDLAYAAGGLYSTVEDLYRWDQALYGDQVLPQDLRDAMFAPHAHASGADGDYDYGYGWHISSRAGRPALWHRGALPGFRSILVRFPADRATVIVLGNIETMDPDTVADKLAEIIFASKPSPSPGT
ncbi:MAG TPA: serine hydrolase domain-containing protein [Roseiflexaceae bacterium]